MISRLLLVSIGLCFASNAHSQREFKFTDPAIFDGVNIYDEGTLNVNMRGEADSGVQITKAIVSGRGRRPESGATRQYFIMNFSGYISNNQPEVKPDIPLISILRESIVLPSNTPRPMDAIASGNGWVIAAPSEGGTGLTSEDLKLFYSTLGIGGVVPNVSLASQLAGQIEYAGPGAGDQAMVAYLRVGTLYNELWTRVVNLANPLTFSEPNRIDEGGSQITGFDFDFMHTPIVLPQYRFVVGYDSFGSEGNDNSLGSIQLRIIDDVGDPVGEQTQVNTYVTGHQGGARVAAGAEGFVVVWASEGSPGDDDSLGSIQARRYSNAGIPLGDQFQVNQNTMGGQGEPDVAMAGDGRFVITWLDRPLSTNNVAARVYGPDGTPQGDQFQLNVEPGAHSPAIGIEGNDLVIAWIRAGSIEGVVSFEQVFADGFELETP